MLACGHSRRRFDDSTERAIEPPLPAERRASAMGKEEVTVGATTGQHLERRFCGELRASKSKSKPVARDRIDEPGGIAGQQQSWCAGRTDIHGKRAKDGGPRHHSRMRKSIA